MKLSYKFGYRSVFQSKIEKKRQQKKEAKEIRGEKKKSVETCADPELIYPFHQGTVVFSVYSRVLSMIRAITSIYEYVVAVYE